MPVLRWAARTHRFLPVVVAILVLLSPVLAEEEQEDWVPQPPMPSDWDWIQMTSGEWLKGELIAMYDDELEFDSDEFDLQTLDWGDVQQVRTARVMQIGFLHGVTAIGKLFVEGDAVRVMGEQDQTFERSDLITIAAGEPKEINYWSAKVMLGLNVRRGNTNVAETTLDARFTRRTVRNRINFAYIANLNETEGQEVSNNHRLTIGWNQYVSNRLYVSPVFFEWFKDRFQNINHRETLGAGLGYQLVDTSRFDWNVNGGPAYQTTTYDSVEQGDNPDDTPALIAGTVLDVELTGWMDFFYEYRLQWVDESAGQYNHHMLGSFETDITSLLDFDVTLIWDRIQKPRQDADGNTPLQDDFRLTVGLTFEW